IQSTSTNTSERFTPYDTDQDPYIKRLKQFITDYGKSLAASDDVSTAKPKREVTVQSSGNILLLGQALDISFPAGYMAVFEFTTGQAGEYRYFTGSYGGTSGP